MIEKYKSGYDLPEDIPFEDLSNPRNGDISNSYSNKTDISTVKGTLSGGKNKKRGRILNIFSNAKVWFSFYDLGGKLYVFESLYLFLINILKNLFSFCVD